MGLVSYDIIYMPPPIEAPTGLTLSNPEPGRLDIDVVHPTAITVRFTFVEVTTVEDDWTDALVVAIPHDVIADNLHTAVLGLSGQVWVRARGADAWGNFSLYSDTETTTLTGTSSGTMWVPLLDGDDGFVWLDHELIYINVETPA